MAFFLVQEAEMSLCDLWGTPCEGGLPEGSLFGPLFGHFWGSKMTPFNPQMGLFAIVI